MMTIAEIIAFLDRRIEHAEQWRYHCAYKKANRLAERYRRELKRSRALLVKACETQHEAVNAWIDHLGGKVE